MGSSSPYIPESGLTIAHFEAFREAARQEGVIAVVRNTNRASTPLIEQGCPGKPLEVKFHTDPITGVVTARGADEVAHARRLGYAVVDDDRIARGPRGSIGLDRAFWKVAPGQVIDVASGKPLVGDYDLMGVFHPASPGRNLALVSSNGQAVRDVTSPAVRQFAARVNASLDRPRVLHGAQDQFAAFRGGATAFLPDGGAVHLTDEFAVERFYREWGRATREGRYGSITAAAGAAVFAADGMRLESSRLPMPGTRDTFSSRLGRVVRNQDAFGWIGESLGSLFLELGDLAIRRRIEQELRTIHATTIDRIRARGHGVLVIVRMQEWARADFNGMKARSLVGVHVVGGPTKDAALETWRRPSIMQGPRKGWVMMAERYQWIPASLRTAFPPP